MKKTANSRWVVFVVLAVALITASLTAIMLVVYFSKIQFHAMGDLCEKVIAQYPDSRPIISETLKNGHPYQNESNILHSFGYDRSDFIHLNPSVFGIASIGVFMGFFLFLLSYLCLRKKMERKNTRVDRKPGKNKFG